MKIQLNESRCEGYGFCEETAPELFHLDVDGDLELLKPEISEAERERAEAAARACPVAALTVVDD